MPRRLRHTRDSDLCVRRYRQGKGFTFRDAEGNTITDKTERQRLLSLAIPPAWREVEICRYDNGHVQVRGRDDADRVQYIYHPDWERQRDARKLERLQILSAVVSRVRKKVNADLSSPKGSERLAEALAVALIDRTAMRIGRERYLRENGTRGASTLLKSDLTLKGALIKLAFKGKGGKAMRYEFTDQKIAGALRRIMTLRGRRLFQFRDDDGRIKPLKPEMVNAYLREICDADISAKDLRMFHASAAAGEILSNEKPAKSERGRERQIGEAAKQVAEMLQNTPAITRKSYIARPILKSFKSGRLAGTWLTKTRKNAVVRTREQHLRGFIGEARN